MFFFHLKIVLEIKSFLLFNTLLNQQPSILNMCDVIFIENILTPFLGLMIGSLSFDLIPNYFEVGLICVQLDRLYYPSTFRVTLYHGFVPHPPLSDILLSRPCSALIILIC